MRLATALLAAALLTCPAALAGSALARSELAGPGTAGVDCNVIVPDDPGRGAVCAVEMAFCVMAVALMRPCGA